MVRFYRDGHVLVVDEQLVVGRRDLVGGHEFVFGHIVGRREKSEKRPKVGADAGRITHRVN